MKRGGLFLVLAFVAGCIATWETAYDAGFHRAASAKPLNCDYFTSKEACKRAELQRLDDR